MKNLITLVLPLLIGYSAQAQQPNQQSLFWKITSPNTKTSYLFGTMHLMCPSDIVVGDNLKTAFNSAGKLYLELDMDDPKMMMEVMMGMQMKDNQSLDNLLPKEQLDSAAQVFQKLSGFPLTMFKKAQPMLIMSMIYPAMMKCETGGASGGWETTFMQMAKNSEKEVLGLEKVSDQLAVFNKIPYDVQAKMFANTLLNLDSTKKEFNKMVAAYKTRKLDALHNMVSADEDFGKYEDAMLNSRNKNWIPVIENAVKDQSIFIAVGAAHLAGENGVINLLRQKGFTVEPLQE